ncbi:MAG TPA: thioredoxin domain-containing protein [Jiangellaceae bacterium]|nr:thioredoxin domain-containing protein [Jiangellaceae bacterium]
MVEPTSGVIRRADDSTYDEVTGAGGPVLVEFFAPWCGSCRRLAPTLDRLATEYAGRVAFVMVNVDENPGLVRRYQLSSTPTLMLLKDHQPVETLIGAQSAEAVRDLLASLPQGLPDGAATDWVPDDACTLPTAQQPLRVAEFDDLFVTALRDIDRRAPEWLRLRLSADSGVQESAAELIEQESGCCAFFDFDLAVTDAGLHLDVRVPLNRVDVLDGLSEHAASALARAGAA